MSRAKFGLSKILKLTSSRSGQPPRAGQAHCHDSISLGGLPGLLLHLSSPTLQKSSESAGYSHRSPGRCPIPLWKTLALKTVSGILPGMTCSFSLCHLRSHWHGDDPQCREAYLSWVSGSTLSSQITHLLGAVDWPWCTCCHGDQNSYLVERSSLPQNLAHILVLWEYYLSSPVEDKRGESHSV